MEKFSKYRDASTGIQVFLTPVPPAGSNSLAAIGLFPLVCMVLAVRALLIIVISALWTFFCQTLGSAGRSVMSPLNAIFGRAFLFGLGITWIDSQIVSLKGRGRASGSAASDVSRFAPRRGDIILCNWSSWVDVIYLTSRFAPTFLYPVVSSNNELESEKASQSPSRSTVTRRQVVSKGQQQQDEATRARTEDSFKKERLLGWKKVSMYQMAIRSGRTPVVSEKEESMELEAILKQVDGPVVIFPELVTSNNRGLLRFESVFPHSWRSLYKFTGSLRMGKGQPNLFLMTIKHDPPTSALPTATHSVPNQIASPLPHLFSIIATPTLGSRGMNVRMLVGDESPTSPSYPADAGAAMQREGALMNKCADLMSSLSRLRRTGLNWEDKEGFLTLFQQ